MAFYNITGQYDKVDSLAEAFDAEFLGPCIVSRFLFSRPPLFHLSATPNFAARLKDLGSDPVSIWKRSLYNVTGYNLRWFLVLNKTIFL